jgi:hypothetical protein
VLQALHHGCRPFLAQRVAAASPPPHMHAQTRAHHATPPRLPHPTSSPAAGNLKTSHDQDEHDVRMAHAAGPVGGRGSPSRTRRPVGPAVLKLQGKQCMCQRGACLKSRAVSAVTLRRPSETAKAPSSDSALPLPRWKQFAANQ